MFEDPIKLLKLKDKKKIVQLLYLRTFLIECDIEQLRTIEKMLKNVIEFKLDQ